MRCVAPGFFAYNGGMTLPLDWDATIARWGRDQVTGAAAGSST